MGFRDLTFQSSFYLKMSVEVPTRDRRLVRLLFPIIPVWKGGKTRIWFTKNSSVGTLGFGVEYSTDLGTVSCQNNLKGGTGQRVTGTREVWVGSGSRSVVRPLPPPSSYGCEGDPHKYHGYRRRSVTPSTVGSYPFLSSRSLC